MQNTPLALDCQFVSSSNTPTRVSFRVQCILQQGDIGYSTWRVCIPHSKGTRTRFVIAWLLPTNTWAYQTKIGNFTSEIRLKHGGGSVGYTLSSIVSMICMMFQPLYINHDQSLPMKSNEWKHVWFAILFRVFWAVGNWSCFHSDFHPILPFNGLV